MAISPVHLRHVDMKKQQLFLKLGDEESPVFLHPAALSIDDFSTLRLWQGNGSLLYDFGLQDGCEFTQLMQGVIRSLVKGNRFHPDKTFRLPRHMDADGCKTEALTVLRSHGLVSAVTKESWTEWTLTEVALQRLQTSEIFTVSEMVLCPAGEDVELKDRTTFELLCDMQREGWSLRVHEAGQRVKKNCAVQEHPRTPYRAGDAKLWWLRAGSSAIDSEYLRALLAADEHGECVPHFQTSGFYAALWTGVAPVASTKRKKQDFVFLAVGDRDAQVEMLVDKPARAAAQDAWPREEDKRSLRRLLGKVWPLCSWAASCKSFVLCNHLASIKPV